jgi:hypothetical protein
MDAEELRQWIRNLLATEPERLLLWQSALVPPRRARCSDPRLPDPSEAVALDVWLVLVEEDIFGLAAGEPETPFLLGWYGGAVRYP